VAYLPLANLLHWKLRSALSAAGIGIGVCMLVTLTGLSRGSVDEVADRWEAVEADLIVCPRVWGEDVTAMGASISDRYAPKMLAEFPQIVADVVPVALGQLRLGGQGQLAAGVDPSQWRSLTGGRGLSQGRLFDPDGRFAKWIEQKLLTPVQDEDANQVPANTPTPEDLEVHGGLELVIDERLARKARLGVGDVVESANCRWHVVGIVPAGGMTRVYMPRRTAQFLFGKGLQDSSLLFVKLKSGADAVESARKLRTLGPEVLQLRQYRDSLQRKLGIMYLYVDIVNAVSLAISFLFIMVTLYTMVLQRTREIAILRSLGASRAKVMRGVLAEALLLTAAGTAAGVAAAFLAGWLIQSLTLYSVTITAPWIGVAVAAAAAGAILAGLYPAWRASKVDVVEALTFE
jgi:putative ABC transport system permease protein